LPAASQANFTFPPWEFPLEPTHNGVFSSFLTCFFRLNFYMWILAIYIEYANRLPREFESFRKISFKHFGTKISRGSFNICTLLCYYSLFYHPSYSIFHFLQLLGRDLSEVDVTIELKFFVALMNLEKKIKYLKISSVFLNFLTL
jgi:hypothetical protein